MSAAAAVVPFGPVLGALLSMYLIGGALQGNTQKFFAVIILAIIVAAWVGCLVLVVVNRKDLRISRALFVASLLSSTLCVSGILLGVIQVVGLINVFAICLVVSIPTLGYSVWNRMVTRGSRS